MSENQVSPDAKRSARHNILKALEGARTSSPPVSPTPLPRTPPSSAGNEVFDEVDRERQPHLLGGGGVAAKMQQLEPKAPTLPRSAKQRSPRHSPTSSSSFWQGNGDKQAASSSKPLPLRPPPPKSAALRRTPPVPPDHDTSPPSNFSPIRKPPGPKSSIRRPAAPPDADTITSVTSLDTKKPKPPIRTRKKKFVSVESSARQSEFVELSASDIIVDCGGEGEDLKVIHEKEHLDIAGKGIGGTSVLGLAGVIQQKLDEEEGDGGGSGEEAERVQAEELDKDGWDVIPADAAAMVEDDHNNSSDEDYPNSPSLSHRDVSKIEEVVRALTLKKGKTPPFRPPPYAGSIKTPPLPSKKKKSVTIVGHEEKWSQVAEEVSCVATYMPTATDKEEAAEEGQITLAFESTNEHIYEAMEAMEKIDAAPAAVKENPRVIVKQSSLSSLDVHNDMDSSSSRSPILVRAGTMSGPSLPYRNRGNDRAGEILSRPKSEVPIAGTYGELESSFEVIPIGTDLDSVMTSLRQTDEKYQDASIYDLIQACSKALPHVTSTAELPPRLTDFPDRPRAHVIHELYFTEYNYVKGLEVLCEVFRDNLGPILGDEASHIFANVDDILSFNKSFLALLHSQLKDLGPEARIGDLFMGMFTQAHKSMYAIYCSNYDSAEMTVSKLRKRKDFEQVLISCYSNTRLTPGLTLPAYLITPVQRVPRYILLLKDIVKHTSDRHPDKKSLLKALGTMGELADYIDAQVRESQTKKTFAALKNKVHGLADLDSPERALVKEGQVYLKNIKKLYQCILFNDLLVFAHGDSKQSKVELQLDLEALWFEDLGDLDPQTSGEDAIEIYTPERPYTIYTRSNSEKRLWLNKLRDTIYQYLLKKTMCESSTNSSTVSRHSTFVYNDGRVYNGQYVDSRRNGKGTMTWPNKTVYVGDWIDDERCDEGELKYNTGEVYHGKWSEDKQNGFGELQFASNDIYRGHWKDGIRHGAGKILYANGDKFEGHFVQGHIEGRGKLICTNGVLYDGEWKHSERHGKGRLRTSTKNVYEGEFQNDQLCGQGRMVFANRDVYTGQWKNGMRNGGGKMVSLKEGTYEGTWEDDLCHGAGKQSYRNGDIYEGGWERNKRHARGKLRFSTGEIYDGAFVNNVICGEGEMVYGRNFKYHGHWLNGLRHGSGTMTYTDSSIYKGEWLNGVRHGKGEYKLVDGTVYKGDWAYDKFNGKGTLSISYINYTYNGEWVNGKREGRGDEASQYGHYKGSWKADLKHGYGEERSLVGTIFDGNWERGKKNGRGVRRMIFGAVDDQIWKNGQLSSDFQKMTAIELPFLSRNDT